MYTDRSRHREKTFRSLSAFMEEPGCMEIKKGTSTIAVSYTHLDVYKRQVSDESPMGGALKSKIAFRIAEAEGK